jgi:creatinine amidohydrolase/Fe(II)-dependent formamide hydrolase-like protein
MTIRPLLALLAALSVTAAPSLDAQGGRGDSTGARGGRGGGRGRGPAIPATGQALPTTTDLVELEMMTWPEVKRAIRELGKTTALVYNGGTETRGPQNVNGGHTLMARATVKAIAQKLGNAIAAPVLAYSPNNANPELPGTIGLSTETFKAINREIAEQLIRNGFRNVMLMGDHGGGQAQLGELAQELDAKYSPEGIHVYFIGDAYAKAQGDFEQWLADNGYPCASHAGIPDTSEMMYLGLDKGWVRAELIPTAVGNYVPCPGKPVDSVAAARPRVNNGINGDARRSSVELGKMAFEYKVNYAVKQIQGFLATQKP